MSEYVFDDRAADDAVLFFERFLRHVKGEWTGTPIVLEQWQRDEIIRPLFGWKLDAPGTPEHGLRRYRTLYAEVPRKNAKIRFSHSKRSWKANTTQRKSRRFISKEESTKYDDDIPAFHTCH